MSVIADKKGQKFVISTYPNNVDDYLNKIKDAADLIYEKPDSGGTAENDPQNLAGNNTNDTQSPKNISQSTPKIKEK